MRIYLAGPLFTPYEREFLDTCATRLRESGFDVFVPHEQALALGKDVTAAAIFAKDLEGLAAADAVFALLDGSQVDDGTAVRDRPLLRAHAVGAGEEGDRRAAHRPAQPAARGGPRPQPLRRRLHRGCRRGRELARRRARPRSSACV